LEGRPYSRPLERSRLTESGLAFLIDCEEDRTLRAVLVGMLRRATGTPRALAATEESLPHRWLLATLESFVFPASFLGDSVEVVLGVFFGWWARWPKKRHVLRPGVLTVRAAFNTHALNDTPGVAHSHRPSC
jgi:hypothetical protein